MADSISSEECKSANFQRLKFLPRIAVTVDFAGKKMTYRNAPLIEALLSAYDNGGMNFKNLLNTFRERLKEVLQVTEEVATGDFEGGEEEIQFSAVSPEVEQQIDLAEKATEMEDDWQTVEKSSDINLREKVSNLSQEARDLF